MVQWGVDRKSTVKKGHLGDIPVVALEFGSSWAHHLWNLKNPTTISFPNLSHNFHLFRERKRKATEIESRIVRPWFPVDLSKTKSRIFTADQISKVPPIDAVQILCFLESTCLQFNFPRVSFCPLNKPIFKLLSKTSGAGCTCFNLPRPCHSTAIRDRLQFLGYATMVQTCQ